MQTMPQSRRRGRPRSGAGKRKNMLRKRWAWRIMTGGEIRHVQADGDKGRMGQDVIIETRDLTKEFKGFVAVNNCNLSVRRGEIHALIGPNGAGKTTFFNLLTKFLTPTRGTIIYNGADITSRGPAELARRG